MKKSSLLISATLAFGLLVSTEAPALAYYFGAAAAGMWRDDDGRAHVTIGTGGGNTVGAAQQQALNSCHSDGGMNCSVVRGWSDGQCGYITLSVGGGKSVAYGTGSTKQAAYDACYAEDGIINCDTDVLGFCTDRRQ
jgi:hypothetical protein